MIAHLAAGVVVSGILAATYDEQPVITDWPMRIAVSVLFVGGLTALAVWGMRRGWRNRQARQGDIPAPPLVPPADVVFELGVPGLYLGASRAGDWLDRVAVHGLGVRSRAVLHAGPAGIWVEREGAPSIWLPLASIARARIDRGVAGTVRQRDRVLVLSWQEPAGVVDLGFRADERAAHTALVAACTRLGLLDDAGLDDDLDDGGNDELGERR